MRQMFIKDIQILNLVQDLGELHDAHDDSYVKQT